MCNSPGAPKTWRSHTHDGNYFPFLAFYVDYTLKGDYLGYTKLNKIDNKTQRHLFPCPLWLWLLGSLTSHAWRASAATRSYLCREPETDGAKAAAVAAVPPTGATEEKAQTDRTPDLVAPSTWVQPHLGRKCPSFSATRGNNLLSTYTSLSCASVICNRENLER